MKNKPDIRFDGFNDAWEQCRLGDVTDIFDGTHQTPKYTESGVKFVSVENIDTLETEKYISYEAYKKDYSNKQAEIGDVLMTRIGDIGTAKVIETDELMAYYVTLALLKPKKINSNFLAWIIASPEVQRDIWKRTLHIAFPKKINLGEINQVKINISSYEEQQKIGIFFKSLDNLITLHQRELENYKLLKKGFLQKFFPSNGDTNPSIRFDGFTDVWEHRKVNEMFIVTRGQVLAATETSEKQTSEMTYPVYSSQTKNNGLMGYYKDYLFDTAITWTTDGANAGTVNYREGKFYSTNVNGVLLSSDGFVNKAIAEILGQESWKWVSHVGNPKLMNNVMSEISITIPSSLKEQNRLSDFLTIIDNIITLHQRELDNYKELKKGFLQKMFV